jgi:hypothetical protein
VSFDYICNHSMKHFRSRFVGRAREEFLASKSVGDRPLGGLNTLLTTDGSIGRGESGLASCVAGHHLGLHSRGGTCGRQKLMHSNHP